MNSGTINSVADSTVAATLMPLPVPGEENSLSHSSSVVLDTEVPTAISARVAADGASIHVALSESLTPTSLAALESGEFSLDGTSAMVRDVVTIPTRTELVLILTSPSYNPDAYYNPYNPNPPVVPVDPTILPGETVTLTWTNDADTITDSAGNSLSNIADLDVTNEVVPVVESVAQPDFSRGFYKTGDTVSIAVNFSSSVTVTGVPQLTLVVGTNSASAQYVSGSPGTALLFNYIVADGHSTDSLAYSSANALSLNGGSIQSTDASTLAADLTLPEPGTFGSLSGNFFPVVIDNIPPAAPSIDSDLIADDDNISVAERNADDGVQITGTQAADVITVTLCVGATDAADPLCEGGLTYDAAILPLGTTFAPAWGYSLDAVDFTDIGAGEVTLTAIATDAAGNTAVSPGRVITVDAILPGIDDPVAGDNIISAAERDFNAALSLTTTDGAQGRRTAS